MDNDFLDIEVALRRIDGMAISIRELESRVHAVEAHLQIPRHPPEVAPVISNGLRKTGALSSPP
jgi:hypothetical protein